MSPSQVAHWYSAGGGGNADASGAGLRFMFGPLTSTNSPYTGFSAGASVFGLAAGTGTVRTDPMRLISCFMPGAQGVPFCSEVLPLASVHL